jgi:DNA-binding protein YbaB
MIRVSAEAGNPDVLGVIFDQQLFKDDADELEEAVLTALKTAAENGKARVVAFLLERFPQQTKAHCKAGVYRALK